MRDTIDGINEKAWERAMKRPIKLRDMERPVAVGYELDRTTLTPLRQYVDTQRAGDYGADPIGDGTFRMIPSGDIVSLDERNKRLTK